MKWKPDFQKATLGNLRAIYNLRNCAIDYAKYNDLSEFSKEQLIKNLKSISEIALNTIKIVENGEEE